MLTVTIVDGVPTIEINSDKDDTATTWKQHADADDMVDVVYGGSATGSLDFTHGADSEGVYQDANEKPLGTVKINTSFQMEGANGPKDSSFGPVYLNASHTSETAALVVETPYGDMKVWNDSGTVRCSFGANNKSGNDQEIKIAFAIMDADGDEASDVLTLSVEGMVDLDFSTKGLMVDESYLGIEAVTNDKGEVIADAILGTKGTMGEAVQSSGSFSYPPRSWRSSRWWLGCEWRSCQTLCLQQSHRLFRARLPHFLH